MFDKLTHKQATRLHDMLCEAVHLNYRLSTMVQEFGTSDQFLSNPFSPSVEEIGEIGHILFESKLRRIA